MKRFNGYINKTLVLLSDGSYSFCNLNNFNRTNYAKLSVSKISIKIRSNNKTLNKKITDIFKYKKLLYK